MRKSTPNACKLGRDMLPSGEYWFLTVVEKREHLVSRAHCNATASLDLVALYASCHFLIFCLFFKERHSMITATTEAIRCKMMPAKTTIMALVRKSSLYA